MHNNQEIKEIVQKEVESSAAHYFGLMKEWMADQFALMHESILSHQESMERNMVEFRAEMGNLKKNVDNNTLDIDTLQKEQKVIKSDIKELKKNYA